MAFRHPFRAPFYFFLFGHHVFDMRRAHRKWPRTDGKKWNVQRRGAGGTLISDKYTKTVIGAILLCIIDRPNSHNQPVS